MARTRAVAAPPPEAPVTHGDPWWGFDETLDANATATAATASAAARRRAGAGRAKRPLWLRLLTAPLTLLGRQMQRSARVRSWVKRIVVLGALLCIIGGAVGVILLNNLVISRSATLGRLDQERRDLQRENAVLGARTAQLSAPQLVMRRANTELGMIESPTVPNYIYLQPCSRQLSVVQRMHAARRGGSASCVVRGSRSAASATGSPASEKGLK
ncbi:MAG: hypothetical protein JWN41_1157 [Thermoleophilia bacterium]|nr:hypothetical protein [Thermoleophilia bacterium]